MRSILKHLLVIAACIGLLVPPLARGSMIGAPEPMTADAADTTSMNGMPCCPEEPVNKDCAKTCPLMALCATQLLVGPCWSAMPVPVSIAEVMASDVLPLTGLDALPARKPPRLHT